MSIKAGTLFYELGIRNEDVTALEQRINQLTQQLNTKLNNQSNQRGYFTNLITEITQLQTKLRAGKVTQEEFNQQLELLKQQSNTTAPVVTRLRGEMKQIETAFRRGELTAAGAARQLRELTVRAEQLRPSLDEDARGFVSLSNVMNQASSMADRLQGRMTKLSFANQLRPLNLFNSGLRTLQGTVAGLLAAYSFTRIAQGVDASTRKFYEGELALKLYTREMTALGNTAENSLGHLDAFANELRTTSEAIASPVTQLVRYTGDFEVSTNLLRIGAASALAAGKDVQTGADNIAQAIISENSAMLNSIGIAGNLSTAYKQYAQQLGVSVDSLTKAQKAQAAYAFLLEETEGELAALEENFDGLGGAINKFNVSQDRASRALGQEFEPALINIYEAGAALFKVFGEDIIPVLAEKLVPLIETNTEKFTNFVTRLSDTSAAGDDLRDTMVAAATPIAGVGTALLGTGQVAISTSNFILGFVAGVGSALGTLSVQIEDYLDLIGNGLQVMAKWQRGDYWGAAKEYRTLFGDTLESLGGIDLAELGASFNEASGDYFARATEQGKAAIETFGKFGTLESDIKGLLGGLTEGSKKARSALTDLNTAGGNTGTVFSTAGGGVRGFTSDAETAAEALEAYAEGLTRINEEYALTGDRSAAIAAQISLTESTLQNLLDIGYEGSELQALFTDLQTLTVSSVFAQLESEGIALQQAAMNAGNTPEANLESASKRLKLYQDALETLKGLDATSDAQLEFVEARIAALGVEVRQYEQAVKAVETRKQARVAAQQQEEPPVVTQEMIDAARAKGQELADAEYEAYLKQREAANRQQDRENPDPYIITTDDTETAKAIRQKAIADAEEQERVWREVTLPALRKIAEERAAAEEELYPSTLTGANFRARYGQRDITTNPTITLNPETNNPFLTNTLDAYSAALENARAKAAAFGDEQSFLSDATRLTESVIINLINNGYAPESAVITNLIAQYDTFAAAQEDAASKKDAFKNYESILGSLAQNAKNLPAVSNSINALAQNAGIALDPLDKLELQIDALEASGTRSTDEINALREALALLRKEAGNEASLGRITDALAKVSAGFKRIGGKTGGPLGAFLTGMGETLDIGMKIASGDYLGAAIDFISGLVSAFTAASDAAKQLQADLDAVAEPFNGIIDADALTDAFTTTSREVVGNFLFIPIYGEVLNVDEIGLSIAESVTNGLVNGLKNGIDAFLESGDITDLEYGIQQGIYDGAMDALFTAIVEQGIISEILGPYLLELSEAIAEGYETGDYSRAQGIMADLQTIVPKLAAELAPIFSGFAAFKPERDKPDTDDGDAEGLAAQEIAFDLPPAIQFAIATPLVEASDRMLAAATMMQDAVADLRLPASPGSTPTGSNGVYVLALETHGARLREHSDALAAHIQALKEGLTVRTETTSNQKTRSVSLTEAYRA